MFQTDFIQFNSPFSQPAGILNIIGWESGTDNLEATLSGTAATSAVRVHHGNYALRVNPTTTGTGYAIIQKHGEDGTLADMSESVLYIRFYFYAETLPSSAEKIIEVRDTAGALKGEIRLLDTGVLRIVDSTANAITASNAILADTWYMLEWLVPTGTSATSTLRINGVVDGSATGNFGVVDTGTFRLGKATNVNGASVDFYYDDITVRNDDWPNEGAIAILVPNGNGTYTAWTDEAGNNDSLDWNSAADIPHDSDTSYLKSSTNTQVETVNLRNLNTTNLVTHKINAVKSMVVVKAATTGMSIQVRTRSGSTDDDTSSVPIDNTGYVIKAKVYAVDPNTLVDWTVAATDVMEVGLEHNTVAAREGRCTAIYAMVEGRPDLQTTSEIISIDELGVRGGLLAVSSSDLQSLSMTVYTSQFSLSVGGIAQLDTINTFSADAALALPGNAQIITINSFDSSSAVSHIASGEIFTISDVSLNGGLLLLANSEIFTVSELSSNNQVSRLGVADISTISSLESNANKLVLGDSGFITISQLDSSAVKSASAFSEIFTITQLESGARISLIGNFGGAIISEVSANGSSSGGLNACEFITLSELLASANVSHLATGFIETISSLNLTGGLLHVATVDIFTVVELQSDVRVSMVVHAFMGSIGDLSSTGDISGLIELSEAQFMAVVELAASPQVTLSSAADLGNVVVLESDAQYFVGGQVSFDTICTFASAGSLDLPGIVTGRALIETATELIAIPFIRSYTIFGDNEGLPMYVCVIYEDDFIVD